MANVTVTKDRYTVDSLYQWSKDQDLIITGLSLASIPEIHFTNDAMDKAIVRQATMDDAGVITARIPNSLLQKPYKIRAYVCIYEGDSFKSLYLITIPIEARSMPNDYTLTVGDDEVYSFNALENLVNNTLVTLTADNKKVIEEVTKKCEETVKGVKESNQTLETNLTKKYEDTKKAIKESNEQLQTELNQKYANALESCEQNFETQEQNFARDVQELTQTVNARVDNIIAHNNDTNGNTELLDMRVDINGKTHASAGTAVREQIDFLKRILINKTTFTNEDLTNTGSYIHIDGTIKPLSAYSYSNMFKIPFGSKFVFTKYYGEIVGIAFYKNEDFTTDSLISYVSGNDIRQNLPYEVDAPEGAKYFAISCASASDLEMTITISDVLLKVVETNLLLQEKLDLKTEESKGIAEESKVIAEEMRNELGNGNIFITYDDFTNLENPNYLIHNSVGNLVTLNNYSTSKMYPLSKNTTITLNSIGYDNVIAFYTDNEFSDKTFISSIVGNAELISKLPYSVEIPANAKYFALCFSKNDVRFNVEIKLHDFIQMSVEEFVTLKKYIDSTTQSVKTELENDISTFEEQLSKKEEKKSIQEIMQAVLLSDTTIRVKLIGDSITAGVGGTGYNMDGSDIMSGFKVNTSGHCWANSLKSYFESKFNCNVLNYGCSGITSATMLNNISSLIEDTDDIVICMIGTNDRVSSKETLYSNLKSIYQYAKDKNIDIIFMSNIPAKVENEEQDVYNFHMEDVDHIVMKVSAEYRQEYISVYKLFIDYCETRDIEIDTLLNDGVHPNDSGYDVMFYLICKALGFGTKRPNASW